MKLPDPLTSRAVLIGTSDYESLPSLPEVANNLKELAKLFQSEDLWGLPSQHCVVVSNPRSTEEMMDAVWAASEEAKDAFIIYYAGHGQIHGNESELFLTHVGSQEWQKYRAVPYEYIREALKNSQARCKVAILDCCYSGRALGEMSGSDATARLANSAYLNGTYLMAATAENKTATAHGIENFTAFTGELIHTIRNGIPDQPELLEIDTIFVHVRDVLKSKNLPVPQKRETNFAAHIALFRNRALTYSRGTSSKGLYGPIPGVSAGTLYSSRRELYDAGVHRALQAGICGTARRGGAESIVVSGGYKDDEDYGDVIIYTGHGGRNPDTGVQVKDQSPEDPGNQALIRSITTGLPVRVIRGAGGNSEFSPGSGYSYDGLYRVTDYWSKSSIDGPTVLQFRLEQIDSAARRGKSPRPSRKLDPGRWEQVAPGVYSDRLLADELKQLYDYACQICGTILEVPGGIRFAYVVHIRRLEMPHRGPDVKSNMLCLCSNHRDLFNYGSITITDDWRVVDETDGEEIGELTRKHNIDIEHLRYHRQHHQFRRSIDDLIN